MTENYEEALVRIANEMSEAQNNSLSDNIARSRATMDQVWAEAKECFESLGAENVISIMAYLATASPQDLVGIGEKNQRTIIRLARIGILETVWRFGGCQGGEPVGETDGQRNGQEDAAQDG